MTTKIPFNNATREESLKNFINEFYVSIQDSKAVKIRENQGEILDKLICNFPDIKDMEVYSVLIGYSLTETLEQLVNLMHPEVKDSKTLSKLYFLYNEYCFLERHLTNLIERKEGRACCVDKSSWLIREFKKYLLNKEIPDMTIDKECYWKPKFGTGNQWIEFMEGIISLHNGVCVEYLTSMTELLV